MKPLKNNCLIAFGSRYKLTQSLDDSVSYCTNFSVSRIKFMMFQAEARPQRIMLFLREQEKERDHWLRKYTPEIYIVRPDQVEGLRDFMEYVFQTNIRGLTKFTEHEWHLMEEFTSIYNPMTPETRELISKIYFN